MAVTLPINVTVTAQGLDTFKRIAAQMDALQNKIRSRVQRGVGSMSPRVTDAAKLTGFNSPRLQDVTNRMNLMAQSPTMISPSELRNIGRQLNLINREMVITATKGSGLTNLFTNWNARVSSLNPQQQELYRILSNTSKAMYQYSGQMKNANVNTQIANNNVDAYSKALAAHNKSVQAAANAALRQQSQQQQQAQATANAQARAQAQQAKIAQQAANNQAKLQLQRIKGAQQQAAIAAQQRLQHARLAQQAANASAAAAQSTVQQKRQAAIANTLSRTSNQLARSMSRVSGASNSAARNINQSSGAMRSANTRARSLGRNAHNLGNTFGGVSKQAKNTSSNFAGVRSTAQGLMIALSALDGNLKGVLFSFIFFGNGIPALILAVAALAAAIIGLSAAIYKAGRATEDMLNKFRRIRGSAEEAAKTFGIAQTWAIRYGHSISEVSDAMQGLEDHGMLTQRALQATMNLAAARGMTVAEASEAITAAIGEEKENLDSLEKVGLRVNKSLIDVTSRRAVYEATLSAIEEKYGEEAEIRARTTEGALKRIGEAVSASMRTMLSPIWMDMFLPLLNRIANLAAGMYEFVKAMWASSEVISFWNGTVALAKSIASDYREELDMLVRFVKMVVTGAFWGVLIVIRLLVIAFKALMEVVRMLGKVFQWLGRMLKPLADMFRMLWQIILNLDFRKIGQQIKEFLGSLPTLFPKTAAAIERLKTAFSTFIDTFAGPIWDKVKEKVGEIVTHFKDRLPTILETLVSIWNSILGIIDTIVSRIINRLARVFEFLVENKELVMQWVTGVLQVIGSIAKIAIDSVVIGLKVLDKLLKGDFAGALEELKSGSEIIGGHLEEMFEGVIKSWSAAGQLFWKAIQEWWQSDDLDAIVLRGGVDIGTKIVTGIGNAFKGAIADTGDWVSNLFDFSDKVPFKIDFDKQIGTLPFDEIGAYFDKYRQDIFDTHFDPLEFIANRAPQLAKSINVMWEYAVSAVNGGRIIFEGIKKWFNDTFVEGTAFIRTVVSDLVGVFINFFKEKLPDMGKILQDVYIIVQGLWKLMVDMIIMEIGVMVGVLTGNFDHAWESIKTFVDNAQEGLMELVDGIILFVRDVVKLWWEWVEELFDSEFLARTVEGAKNVVANFVAGVTTAWGTVFNEDLWGPINDKLVEWRDAYQEFVGGIAGQVIDNYIAGMKAKYEEVKNAFDFITDALAEWFEDKKEKFAEFGRNIGNAIRNAIGSLVPSSVQGVVGNIGGLVGRNESSKADGKGAEGGLFMARRRSTIEVGEHGPEALTVVPLHKLGSMGGGNVVIEINISGNTLVGNDGTKELARIVSEEIAHKLNRRTAIGFVR